MSAALAPPNGPDKNRALPVYQTAWIEVGFAIVVVGLRFWGRRLSKNTGADDWMMLFTLAIFILFASIATYYGSIGGFRHLFYLATTGANVEQVLFWNYIAQFISPFSYAPAKTAVAMLVLRIIAPSHNVRQGGWRKWLVIATISLCWILTILNCIVVYAQCRPVQALWDESIKGDCWASEVVPHIAQSAVAFNIFTDAVLAFVPASVIYNLRMDAKRRASLIILLGLGIVAGVCGIVKENYLFSLGAHSDVTWETYSLFIWAMNELFVLIFCGSLPPIKPLWDRCKSRKEAGNKDTYGFSDESSGKRSNNLPLGSNNRKTAMDNDRILLTSISRSDPVGLPGDAITRETDIEVSSQHESAGQHGWDIV